MSTIANHVALDGNIYILPRAAITTRLTGPPSPTVAGQVTKVASYGEFSVGGKTITQGDQTKISGTFLSVGSSIIVIGSSILHWSWIQTLLQSQLKRLF